ncbi:MAG: bifunctional pyr operon transcriptional regulator/uracil phosphoribosyltransferase PyrR [Chitinophagaceae bacterium]
MKTLLDRHQLHITLQRLAHQLVENHLDFSETAIIGLQPRGVYFSDRIISILEDITGNNDIVYGRLDFTFYRDDLHKDKGLQAPDRTDINFEIEGKRVVLLDDVLHTGRTTRAAMDALLDFGRPREVEFMTLIDRRFSRELPIQPDYTGLSVDTLFEQKVKVLWKEKDGKDEVVLL